MKYKLSFLMMLSVLVGICSAANPQVTLHVTGAVTGDIVLEIYADKAPVTADNFLNYVRTGFYDGLIFHRVKSGFMIQGGGFDTNLIYKTPGNTIINESSNGLTNLRGTIAMARLQDPHSASSQFYINHVYNSHLDGIPIFYSGGVPYRKFGYCVFGSVISGMDVVDAIALVTTKSETTIIDGQSVEMTDVPVNDVIIHAAVTYDPGVCALAGQGDINGDCTVDLLDFLILAEHWLYGKIAADIDVDGKVNYNDYNVFASHWMETGCASPNWCGGADVNKNGSVDSPDVLMLARHWMTGT